jgi:HSP20 family protein
MSLMRRFDKWDPVQEIEQLRGRLDRLVETAWPSGERHAGEWAPASDVVERDDALVVRCELPGVKENDISVEIENGTLMIRGERHFEKKEDEKNYKRIERSYGTFYRGFTLPPDSESDKVTAAFADGLLEIIVPKSEETKSKKITISKKLPPVA